MDEDEDEPDALGELVADLISTPEGRAAMAAAAERQRHTIERPCSEGNCTEWVDTRNGEHYGGMGPVGCPCQHIPTPHAETRESGETL